MPDDAPEFVKEVTAEIMAERGDSVPVSKMPDRRQVTRRERRKFEKRNIAVEIPEWEPEAVHSVRHVLARLPACDDPDQGLRRRSMLPSAPATFKSVDAKGKDSPARSSPSRLLRRTAPAAAPACRTAPAWRRTPTKQPTGRKAINMVPQEPLREPGARELGLLPLDSRTPIRRSSRRDTVKGSQFMPPLFEFSGACAGCGETPYVKLVTQLFGDRAIIANATGCSSIYGGNLPTTPYTTREDGRGPAWCNSLFEDNAEFGMGIRLTVDKFNEYALELLDKAVTAKGCVDKNLAAEIRVGQDRRSVRRRTASRSSGATSRS